MKKDFPINVFPDVNPADFKKYNKKNVTEDYIKENLKRKGWECYKPFTDTGIDLIATKTIKDTKIYRYIQIKTRSLVDNKFGYTLTPKDFVTDPRKFYLLFCDTTNDVILISTYDYLKMCDDNYGIGKSHFGSPSFRTYNNKLNSLTFDEEKNKWFWRYKKVDGIPGRTVYFDNYLNDKGLKNMENPKYDNRFDYYLKKVTDLKFKLFYKLNKTSDNKTLFAKKSVDAKIQKALKANTKKSDDDYKKQIEEIRSSFSVNYPQLYKSHLGYEKGEGKDDE